MSLRSKSRRGSTTLAQRQSEVKSFPADSAFGPRSSLFVVDVATSAFLLLSPTLMRRSRKTSPAHILLPAAIAKSIPRLGETSNQSDPILHVKWFTPDANFTWYVARFCPDQRIAYGFVIGHDSEWGTFSLDEIEQLRGRLGLPVERDLHFDPIPASQLPQF